MSRPKGAKNTCKAPQDIEQARKMARIKAVDAAPIWGMAPATLALMCLRKEVPEAKKLGMRWYVTPRGMDMLFERRRRS